jgi:predicted DNA-binding protein (UPF0251 family)
MKNQEKTIAALLILLFLAIMTLPLWARTTAPGAQQGPGQSQIGKRNPGDRGAWLLALENFKNKSAFVCTIAQTNFVLLNNIYVGLQKCKFMQLFKQHVILNLIASKRYELDPLTGAIVSNIGKERRVLKPIEHYSGYLQYVLDIGFNERLTVYGQGFAYLATYKEVFNPKYVIDHINCIKSDNRPQNLRCITERENLQGSHSRGLKKGTERKRLPIDQKEAIKQDFLAGISQVKIAEKYKTTRQTVAKIVNVK